MQLTKNICLFWLLLIFIFPTNSFGQISIPDADFIDTTEYINNDLGQHLIAVFSPKRGNYPENVELQADFNDTLVLNYKWLKLNETTFDFDSLAFDGNTTSSSYIAEGESGSDEKNGCYKLEIIGNGVDTAFYVWVYISTFQISGINILLSTCDEMQLDTDLDIDDGFNYFDLVDNTPLVKEHMDTEIIWETVPDTIVLDDVLDPIFPAPTEYLRFNLTIKDNFGQSINDYLDIKEYELDDTEGRIWLRATKAEFEASRTGVLEGDSVTGGEAPMNMQFVNKSENAIEFEWTFYNDYSWIEKNILDSVIETSNYETPLDSITYYYPKYWERENPELPQSVGEYDVSLMTKGPEYTLNSETKQCVDVERKYSYILVDFTKFVDEHSKTGDSDGKLKFANVFTPNNDNKNDVFHLKGIGDTDSDVDDKEHELMSSIREFSIKIYSRWGDKVHDYNGNIYDWNGWDGMTSINRPAKPGVYYYSVFATGWDGKTYNTKGFVHLFISIN